MCGSNLVKKSLSGPEAVTEKIVKAVVGAVPDDPGWSGSIGSPASEKAPSKFITRYL